MKRNVPFSAAIREGWPGAESLLGGYGKHHLGASGGFREPDNAGDNQTHTVGEGCSVPLGPRRLNKGGTAEPRPFWDGFLVFVVDVFLGLQFERR